MFWRSFNLTFKANLFDEILMQPQKILFFGFFSELSLENLVSSFQFFVVPSANNSSPVRGFCFPLQKSTFFGNFSRLPQAAKLVVAVKGQKWFFNEQKSFFRTTTELTFITATLQCVLQPFEASHFKVSIHENFFSLYLAALSRE